SALPSFRHVLLEADDPRHLHVTHRAVRDHSDGLALRLKTSPRLSTAVYTRSPAPAPTNLSLATSVPSTTAAIGKTGRRMTPDARFMNRLRPARTTPPQYSNGQSNNHPDK